MMDKTKTLSRTDGGARRIEPIVALLIALGCALRLWQLGSVPAGIHQDEAFAAYEAYCLLETGLDSWGYPFPVYFTAWSSGMNALGIYLMMPFVKLFGLEMWAIRMPQAVVACLTLPAFYGVMRRLFGERTGRIALLLLAICPWHVGLARWGLESNLAPGMLIFGLYCFLRGLENPRFYLLSALIYGVSLYAYATIWPVVPMILALLVAYALRRRRITLRRLIACALILLALALPLLLFLLINYDVLPEIVTPFFSIPRMKQSRTDEISLGAIGEHAYTMLRMIVRQKDADIQNAPLGYGLYYPLSLPLMAIGLLVAVAGMLPGRRGGERLGDGAPIVLAQLVPALVMGCLIEVNVVRLNCVHMPVLMLTALGADAVGRCLPRHGKRLLAALMCAYGVMGAFYVRHYFTDYNERIKITFRYGIEEALDRAKELAGEDGTIDVLGRIKFPLVLFCDETPPEDYRSSVVWRVVAEKSMETASFTRYRFGEQQTPADVIIADFDADLTGYADYAREEYGWITVLHR